MAPYLLFFLISLAALAYGTYTDFKERIVSNWVTYGMVAVGLGGHAILAFLEADAMIFAYSAGIAALTFFFSYLLYKVGVWAGGDVKLFTGLAALNPANPAILARLGILNMAMFQSNGLPIFPLSLFMFSLFAMLPYGAALAGARLLKNRTEKKKFVEDSKDKVLQALEVSGAVVGLNSAMLFLGLSQLLVLPILFLFFFLPGKARAVVAGLLLVFALWFQGIQTLEQFAIMLALILGLYLLFKLYSLSKILMRKPVKVTELEEGMISAITIVKRGKSVEILPEMGIKKLIKYFASNKFGKALELMQPKGKEIISSKSAGGLTVQEIEELKRLAAENRIPKEIPVKESAPFVPAVLIAYIALNIVGDVIWFWLL